MVGPVRLGTPMRPTAVHRHGPGRRCLLPSRRPVPRCPAHAAGAAIIGPPVPKFFAAGAVCLIVGPLSWRLLAPEPVTCRRAGQSRPSEDGELGMHISAGDTA